MGDVLGVFADSEGRKWHVCVFRRPSVGSWQRPDSDSASGTVTVVFERPGEERVAVTQWAMGLDSPDSLGRLFSVSADRRVARDRRAHGDRRVASAPVSSEHRSGTDRRTAERRRTCVLDGLFRPA